MQLDVAGLGNALMDALVQVEDDTVLDELGLVRGTMHPVEHARWQEVYALLEPLGVTLDSGGSCANTIATVGRLGGQAVYCGQVGDDQLGRLYASLMEEACGRHALRFSERDATGKCLSIISASDAERTMLTDLGAAIGMRDLGTFGNALSGSKIAHFTGYTLLDGPMRQVVLEAMQTARAGGSYISLDAADPFVVRQTKHLLMSVLDEYVNLVFLNEEEARGLTGLEAEEAARVIRARAKVDTVVVKLGARGSMVLHENEVIHVDAEAVEAVDTTGAGDAYAGGFLYALTQGWNVRACATLASRVASLTVGQVGAVCKDTPSLVAVLARSKPSVDG